MKKTVIAIMIGAAMIPDSFVSAQKFALKPHADITLVNPISLKTDMQMSSKVTTNDFGLDFGYTFWQQHNNRLEVNIGLGYQYLNTSFNAGDFGYDYNAPASADIDGNAYTRFCEVSNLRQKISTGYVTLPIYLQYAYRCFDWMEVHALAGVKLGFNTGVTAKTVTGIVYSYGVFPEYDDLLIDVPYLDDFGDVFLSGRKVESPNVNTVTASLLVGAGLDFRIYGPLWIDLGIRYNVGFTDVFAKGMKVSPTTAYTADTAPVTYTVADGTQARPLSDYLTKSLMSPLSLNVGLSIRF